MKELIQQATSQFGMDESSARSLTGGLLGMIREKAADADFGELMQKLPGASEMVQEPAAAAPGGGMGAMAQGLMQKVGGDRAIAAVDLAGLFKQSGLGAEQGGKFVTMFLGFLRGKAGRGLVARLTDQVPALKSVTA